jgi:hypothetical protein
VESTAIGSTFSRATTPITLTVLPPVLRSDSDTALSLNGTNQYAEVSDTTGSPFDITGAVTLQAWIYPTTDCNGDQAIISKFNSYMMYCGANGYLKYVFDADGASWVGSTSSVKIIKNEWHHIAYTKAVDSTNLLIYVDGYLAATVNAGPTTMTPNNENFSIGRAGTGSYFQGLIDDVRVYNSQRSQAQIQADMKTYGPVTDTDLLAYYDFNEGTGSILYNRDPSFSSASDLTIYGTPAWGSDQISQFSTYGPYSIQAFKRTYLTANSGWRVPSNATRKERFSRVASLPVTMFTLA